MRIMIINGPNLNLLGRREPDIYGHATYADLIKLISAHCNERGVDFKIFQSNHEGTIVEAIQNAVEYFDGIVINPAAYTHTSVAILDALKAVGLPAVEVHISDIDTREEFRKFSYPSLYCFKTVKGEGFQGYCTAIDALIEHINENTAI